MSRVAFRSSIFLLTLVLIGTSPARAEEDAKFSPKLSLRFGSGLLSNSGGANTSFSSRGVSAALSYYLSSQRAIGLGYFTDPPFSGFDIFGRYYFKGLGTRSLQSYPNDVALQQDRLAFYTGLDIMQRSYTYTLKRTSDAITGNTISGTSSTLNVLAGVDHALSSHFELTAEANIGLLNLSATNSLFQVRGYILYTGFSYIW